MSSTTATCAILTVSDTCSAGTKRDTAGPLLAEAFQEAFPHIPITQRAVVSDDVPQIVSKLREWIRAKCTLIFTTGGTGFSPRDVTPEATRAVIDREAPGVSYVMFAESFKVTPMAMLSRSVCGIKDRSLIINLPGSPKGALECFSFIRNCIPHAVSLIMDDTTEVAKVHSGNISSSKVDVTNVADRPRKSTYPMLEVEDAMAVIVKEGNLEMRTEVIKIENALFRVLAEDVRSEDDIPPFDASIKDGYAVIAADGEGPKRVRSFMAAGDAPDKAVLRPGEAVRVGTGAPIPAGADAIVQVEDTSVLVKSEGEEIEININKPPTAGQDIRRSGCDVSKNSTVLKQGDRLSAVHIGVLAAVGKSTVTVYKTVPVGIITTGNELREHHEHLGPGQIRDSNRLALINLLKEYHYQAGDYGIVEDKPDSIKRAVEKVLQENDVLITTGGVSMGEFDFVKRVLLEDFGADIHFGRVNMKPGKPTTFATLLFNGKKKMVFGLPGNPVSACVTFLLFVMPTLRRLEGASTWEFPHIPYIVKDTKTNPDPRPEYMRVIVGYENGQLKVVPNGGQVSSRLNSLVGANGLLLRPGSMKPSEEYLSKIIMISDLHVF